MYPLGIVDYIDRQAKIAYREEMRLSLARHCSSFRACSDGPWAAKQNFALAQRAGN
jgi:hypothetical protein